MAVRPIFLPFRSSKSLDVGRGKKGASKSVLWIPRGEVDGVVAPPTAEATMAAPPRKLRGTCPGTMAAVKNRDCPECLNQIETSSPYFRRVQLCASRR